MARRAERNNNPGPALQPLQLLTQGQLHPPLSSDCTGPGHPRGAGWQEAVLQWFVLIGHLPWQENQLRAAFALLWFSACLAENPTAVEKPLTCSGTSSEPHTESGPFCSYSYQFHTAPRISASETFRNHLLACAIFFPQIGHCKDQHPSLAAACLSGTGSTSSSHPLKCAKCRCWDEPAHLCTRLSAQATAELCWCAIPAVRHSLHAGASHFQR